MAENRVTLEMIARRAGVSRATVSRALRNHHWTSDATSQKVKDAARELGYEPDARLMELMTHLRKRKPKGDRPSLAMLYRQEEALELDAKGGRNNITGALQAAKELGYSLEFFNLCEPRMTPRRLSQIWWNRGISGVIVHPLAHPQRLVDFQWGHFSWIALNYSMREPEMHRVVINYQQVVWLGLSKAFESGSRRIGIMLPPSLDERTYFHYRSAYLGYRDFVGSQKAVPILFADWNDYAKLSAWIERFKPDTIVVPGNDAAQDIRRFLGQHNGKGEKGIRIINLSTNDRQCQGDGVYQDSFEVGREAVKYLVQLIHNGEKGLPENPRMIMVSGIWVAGDRGGAPLAIHQEAQSGAGRADLVSSKIM